MASNTPLYNTFKQKFYEGKPNTVKRQNIKRVAANPELIPGSQFSLPDNYTDTDWKTYNARISNYNGQMNQNVYKELLPKFMSKVKTPTLTITQPEYRNVPQSTVANRASNIQNLAKYYPGVNVTAPTYSKQSFIAAPSSAPNAEKSNYTGGQNLGQTRQAIAGDLGQFTDDLKASQDVYRKEASQRIADRLAARGILGSGIENDAMADLDVRLAGEFDRSRNAETRRLVETQQNFLANEAARKTDFDRGENRFLFNTILDRQRIEREEAGREQEVGFRNALAGADSRENAIGRVMNLTGQETASEQAYNNRVSSYNDREFNNLTSYEKEASLQDVKNYQLQQGFDTTNLANFLSAYSGELPNTGDSNSMIKAIMAGEDSRKVAEIRRATELEKAEAGASASLIGNAIKYGPSAMSALYRGGKEVSSWFNN